ncbi:hypothetical protein [Sphaerisporangium album]|nr:hypothetical protein [Sphaerisporangium album]
MYLTTLDRSGAAGGPIRAVGGAVLALGTVFFLLLAASSPRRSRCLSA